MRFAHFADCHIGSWRDPKIRALSIESFARAVDICIEKQVDFLLISGDLFNTALPSIDGLKETVMKLRELKDKGIAVYAVAGSHDFSPSGKTMLEVLEQAGLLANVARGFEKEGKLHLEFTIDKKTGAKITGLIGKKGSLENAYYAALERESLETEDGFKIFLFHSAVKEYQPKGLEEMDALPLSYLPKGFNYYAAGHVHQVLSKDEKGYGRITYPGPLFPANFKELEELQGGGFYIVESDGKELSAAFQGLNLKPVCCIRLTCDGKSPADVEADIKERTKQLELINTIVTIRLSGCLASGRVSDINFKEIFQYLYGKSAYFVMKNTGALSSKEFEEVKVAPGTVDEIEERLITEHLGTIKVRGIAGEKERALTLELMHILNREKEDGERSSDFEAKLQQELRSLLKLS